MVDLFKSNIEKAAGIIKESKHTSAFTGAGISVESGIPPFRGKDGLWSKYDPKILEINYFYKYPEKSWEVIKEIFYDFFGKAKPNAAHFLLAEAEKQGFLKAVVTQNIDNLHQEAGSKNVYEFHGTSNKTVCVKCGKKYDIKNTDLNKIPPSCNACGGLLKPDFIFFGEGIPAEAYQKAFEETEKADVFLLIGTTGLVQPASLIPYKAKQNDAIIIEINPERTVYTNEIADVFIKGKAGEAAELMREFLFE